MKKRELTRRLKRKALELDFAAVGVTPAVSFPEGRLVEWLARGYHGEMTYLSRNVERRLDPRLVLPGARSAVVVTSSYCQTHPLPYEDPGSAVISKYASGTDYHDVILKRLGALRGWVEDLVPGVGTKTYVDTGPVMEKAMAQQAGIGWIGKNANVISRVPRGSWFFLGVLLLDLELEFDVPESDHCGTCTRCLDACPTGAIVQPYVVDSRLCISYLTIELRSDIPEQLRPPMRNLVFGCDICQDVCPWNRKAVPSGLLEYLPCPQTERPSLGDLANLTRGEFHQMFRGSPIRRAKWAGFMRNIAVAMGNSGSHRMIAPLRRLLDSSEPLVRRHAAWALLQIDSAEAHELVKLKLDAEQDEPTRQSMQDLLLNSARSPGTRQV